MTIQTASRVKRCAFTLVELLLSVSILAVLMVLIVQVISQTSNVWRSSTAKADQFREARDAFEAITRNLSQATLNTYYEYFDKHGARRTTSNASSFVPARYGRFAELRFQSKLASELLSDGDIHPGHAVFFQAPLGFTSDVANNGLNNLLNTWGYYIEFRDDKDRPGFVPGATRRRFRLMEFMQPSEQLDIYKSPSDWLKTVSGGGHSHVIASNVIALVILPKLPSNGPSNDPTVDPDGNKLAPNFAYDSMTEGQAAQGAEYNSLYQLPPVVEVTMVAIDEAAAAELEMKNGSDPPNFGLGQMFKDASPEKRRSDLESLIGNLNTNRISHRVFSTEVSLRGAKWSREQQTLVSATP